MADLLTTGQVQELLQVDRTTIYRMVEDGRLPAIRVGKQWRFVRAELDRWLQNQSSPALHAGTPGTQGGQTGATMPSSGGATAAPPSPDAPAELSDILPPACTQLIQDAFAEMLGVTLVTTDMQGRPITQVSNPCGFFTAATQNAGGAAACRQTWQQLADSVALEPRFVPSETGLLCTRGLIRLRSELKGMVMLGGVAPDSWPPDGEQLAAMARALSADPGLLGSQVAAVYRLDHGQRARALRAVQRIADVFSHIAEDRTVIVSRLQAIAALTAL